MVAPCPLMSVAERIHGIYLIFVTEASEAPCVSRVPDEVRAALSAGSHLEHNMLVLSSFHTHLRSGLASLIASYSPTQLALFVLVLAPLATLGLVRGFFTRVGATDVLARGVGFALAPSSVVTWADSSRGFPGPGTSHWPTWGWIGAYATTPRHSEAGRPTHVASELEVFWTGRGGSFALAFLALSLSARIILVVVLVGIL